MKTRTMLLLASLLLQMTAGHAAEGSQPSLRKDCAELRGEIAAKLEARGVRDYRLDIVLPDELGDARQVGSCDGGTRRIAYQRGVAVPVAQVTSPAPSILR